MGTAQYHLEILEKSGRILSEKENMQRFYFPVGAFGDLERNILKILNQETEREMLLLIIEKNGATQTDIVKALGIAAATANWHLKRLIRLDLIRAEKAGKFKKYLLNGSHTNVVNLLRNYHSSVWDRWSIKLTEMFLSSTSEDDQ